MNKNKNPLCFIRNKRFLVFTIIGTLIISSVLFVYLYADQFSFLSKEIIVKSKSSAIVNPSIIPILISKKMLFVGDIMMARGVAQLTNKYGLEYPFLNIKPLFYIFNWDIIYGNLEGPVRAEAKPVSLFSVRFDYSPEIPQLLAKLGFNLLSIANNHMADQEYSAIDSTRKYLEENHIFSLGDYSDCSLKYSYQKDNFIFLGANLIYKSKYCVQDLIQGIKELKTKDANLYVIVTPHWGTEYTPYPDDFQKQTAHQLIEAGADLIVGHHPHVVQGIEEYQNKLIFYSLGNFVFDMYFSQPVQQELALGFDWQPTQKTFYLFPLQSSKSQLSFMTTEEQTKFFDFLAQISTPSLTDQIRKGMIEK
ncbi:MAG: CapA family protein [Candidatus Paceibacterota bacterium]|jgi:poly-gamma-glutamate synthesis protein (capsule biosynthesis protein)